MSTARSVPEWFGATANTPVPPRVRVRLYDRADGHCEICGRRLGPGDRWQPDHVVALVNGGANSEGNLRVACEWCHSEKTKRDVEEKSRVHRKRVKHLGLEKKRPWHPGLRKKVSGEVVRIGV